MSAALAGPAFIGLAYGFGYGVAMPVRQMLGSSHDMMLLLHHVERAVYALAAAPLVYISWRVVGRFVPLDENDCGA